MVKRKRVPEALHSELTEYSSLIRALRTSHTLDIAAHITKPRPYARTPSPMDTDERENPDDIADDDSRPPSLLGSNASSVSRQTTPGPGVAGPSNLDHPSNKPPPGPKPHKGGSKAKAKTKTKTKTQSTKRDTWTRWPLLAHDIHVPEWGFEDEITHLASQISKVRPPPPLPDFLRPSPDSEPASDDDTNVDMELDLAHDTDSYLTHMTAILSSRLSSVLALLAAHTPSRPPSMQNRIEPLGWRSVVDILSACGSADLVDEKILRNMITRLEAIYPDTVAEDVSAKAVHRVQTSFQARSKLTELLREADESLLALPPTPPSEDSESDENFEPRARLEASVHIPQDAEGEEGKYRCAQIATGRVVARDKKNSRFTKRARQRKASLKPAGEVQLRRSGRAKGVRDKENAPGDGAGVPVED